MDDRYPSDRARKLAEKARLEAKRLGGELRNKMKEAGAQEKVDETVVKLRQLSVKAATWVEKQARELRGKLGDPAAAPEPVSPKKAAAKPKRAPKAKTPKPKAAGEAKTTKRKAAPKRKAPAKSKTKEAEKRPEESAVQNEAREAAATNPREVDVEKQPTAPATGSVTPEAAPDAKPSEPKTGSES